MKRALGYGLLGLAAFLLFLLLRVPANLVTGQVGTRLSDFSVQDVEGTATEGTMLGNHVGSALARCPDRAANLALAPAGAVAGTVGVQFERRRSGD